MLLKKEEKQQQRVNSLLTAKEVAAYLVIDQRTVYRLAKEGRLPAYRIGGQWRFKAEAIEACMHKPHSFQGANASHS